MKSLQFKLKPRFWLTLGGFALCVCVSLFRLCELALDGFYANHLNQNEEFFYLILQKPHKIRNESFGEVGLCLSVLKVIKILLTGIHKKKEGGLSDSRSCSLSNTDDGEGKHGLCV